MSVLAPKPIQKADANPSFERLLDSEEAASLLNIHPKTLQKLLVSRCLAVMYSDCDFGGIWASKAVFATPERKPWNTYANR